MQRSQNPRAVLGRLGEQIALEHVRTLGMQPLARNARTRHGEIDIVARDGRTIVFIEVKARRGGRASGALQPLEAVRAGKRARLRRLAAAWLREHAPEPRPTHIRLDAIGVVVDHKGAVIRIDHVEGWW